MSSLSSLANSSVVNSLLTSSPTVSGLASGLDTNKLIQSLVAIQQAQVTTLQNNQKQIADKQTAFKGIEARLLTLQTQVFNLARSQNNVFDLRSVTSSSPSLLSASASSSAAAGIYTLHVGNLATANQIASQGFDSAGSQISQGTITVSSGSASTTLTIDSSNATLQGLASAINNAGIGVSASIINDGSASQAFRLVLTATKTGLANAVTVTNNLGPDGGGAVQPLINTTLQEAVDATVTLGSGVEALTVHSASNQVNTLISGVTLNLQNADPSTAITLTVANDVSQAADAIKGFVSDFNDLMGFIDQQVSFDPQSGQGGVLLGNYQATQIQDQLRAVMGTMVSSVNSKMNRLGALGITFNNQGQLNLDQSKLASALNGQVAGTTLNDVRRLFALTAASSSTNVQFVTGSVKTKPSSSGPYQVSITQAAEQASVTGANTVAASTILTSANNTFSLSVDGVNSNDIVLAPGTYNEAELAQELQKEINGQSSLQGLQVSVGVVGDKLTITSNSYGSNSKISITGGTALTDLGFAGTETATGKSVAGSFVVNGVNENATGTGQYLVGSSSNANTADLQVRVLMTPSQVGGGAQTDLTVTRGLASMMDAMLNSMLDPINGRLKSIDSGFQSVEDNIQTEIDRQNAALQAKQASLTLQFTAMETAISQLQSMGNYLTLQFNSMFSQPKS